MESSGTSGGSDTAELIMRLQRDVKLMDFAICNRAVRTHSQNTAFQEHGQKGREGGQACRREKCRGRRLVTKAKGPKHLA